MNTKDVLDNFEARKTIKELLIQLGFKPELDGFDQICSAIMLEISKAVKRKGTMYKEISNYLKNPSERAIARNIARVIKNVENLNDKINNLLNNGGSTITTLSNGYIISAIAAYFEISGKLNSKSFGLSG